MKIKVQDKTRPEDGLGFSGGGWQRGIGIKWYHRRKTTCFNVLLWKKQYSIEVRH